MARDREFAYGSFDCFLFVAECVEAMTGVDYSAEFRGYDSKRAAYKIISRYGAMDSMIAVILNRTKKPIAFAQRGDVVIADVPVDGEIVEAVGICEGVHSWFASPNGVTHLSTSSCKAAWSIE